MRITLETQNNTRPVVRAIETDRTADIHVGALLDLLNAVAQMETAFERLANHASGTRSNNTRRERLDVTPELLRALARQAGKRRR